MDNRRHHRRFHLDQLVLEQFNRDTFIGAIASDISSEGLGFITDSPIDVHSEFFFMATLDLAEGSSLIRGNGIALYCDPDEEGHQRVGIKFTEMDSHDEEILHRFLEEKDPREAGE